jgi:hypothetical protein
MKVIKLDRRHRLHRLGFAHAFKFDNYGAESAKITEIERTLYEIAGDNGERNSWFWHWSRYKRETTVRPYYIGVRDETMITQILLMTA